MAETSKKTESKTSDSNSFKTDAGSVSVQYEQHATNDARYNVVVKGTTVGYVLKDDSDKWEAHADLAQLGAGFGVARPVTAGASSRKDAVQALLDELAPHADVNVLGKK